MSAPTRRCLLKMHTDLGTDPTKALFFSAFLPLAQPPPLILVPEERLMRRVAQIGAGKIFGSLAFVTATAFALGDRFRSRSVAAREVGELGYATHGWRLAKAAERAA